MLFEASAAKHKSFLQFCYLIIITLKLLDGILVFWYHVDGLVVWMVEFNYLRKDSPTTPFVEFKFRNFGSL